LLFFKAGMLSLRSGLFLLGQANLRSKLEDQLQHKQTLKKERAPSAAVSRGKPERKAKNSERPRPLSAYRHLSPERERTKNKLLHPAIRTLLYAPCDLHLATGLGYDGRRKR
jgi:hypothetical protein